MTFVLLWRTQVYDALACVAHLLGCSLLDQSLDPCGRAAGIWEYRYEYQSFRVKCDDDPFKTPVGKAQIPGVVLGKGYYSFEEAPRIRFWPRARYLRFLERSDEGGQLFERFRLIFDDYGWPRYERLFETGERSTNDYEIRVHLSPHNSR